MESGKVLKPTWKALFYFLTYGQVPIVIIGALASLIAGATISARAYVLGKLFGLFTDYNDGVLSKDEFKQKVRSYNIYVACLATGCWISNSLAFFLWHWFAELQAQTARSRIFKTLLSRNIEWFEKRDNGTSALTLRLLTHMNELRSATSQPISMASQYTGTVIASFALAFYLSWKLTMVIIAGIPLAILLLPIFSSRVQPNLEAQSQAMGKAAQILTTAVTAVETVKFNNAEGYEAKQYQQSIEQAGMCFSRQAIWNSLQAGCLRFIILSMMVQGFWFGSVLIDRGEIQGTAVLSAFWAAIVAVQALIQVLPLLITLERGKAAGQKLHTALMQWEQPITIGPAHFSLKPTNCIGDISIIHLTFYYPTRPEIAAIDNVNMFFAAGETTFVVGESGSGKSTLGQLLTKIYDFAHGEITLDEISLQKLDTTWVRQHVLLVEQQSILFQGSIKNNIALGCFPNMSELTDEDMKDIQSAAMFAQIAETIQSMPKHFDTEVGSKGTSLSGGQRQRIALARAWLRNPSVLILDESISALDHVNREQVLSAIRKWRKGKTTIVIAHDVTQIQPDDFIYVMKSGSVVQEGFRKTLEILVGSPFHDLLTASGQHAASSFGNARKGQTPSLSSISSEYVDEILEQYLYETSDIRQSTIIPTVLSHMENATYRRSGVYTTTVAPFWNIVPQFSTPDWISSLPEENEDSGSEAIALDPNDTVSGYISKIKHTVVQNSTQSTPKSRSTKMALNEPPLPRLEVPDWTRTRLKANEECQNMRPYAMKNIVATIWPRMNRSQRAILIAAASATIVSATSIPAFAYVFSKLVSTFYETSDRKHNAMVYSLAVLGVAMADSTATGLSTYLLSRSGQVWVNNIRAECLQLILTQPRQFFDKPENSVSRIADAFDQQAEEMQNILGRFLGYLLMVVVMLCTGVIWSLIVCWKITMVVLACTPAMLIITDTLNKVGAVMDRRWTTLDLHVGSIFVETFTNIKTVRALCLEQHFHNQHRKAAHALMKMAIQRAFAIGLVFGLSESAMYYLTALLFWYGSVVVASGDFDLNSVFRVMTLLLLTVSNTTMIMAAIPGMSVAREGAAQLLRFITLPPVSHEHQGTVKINVIGDITFHNVNFTYPQEPKNRVLKGVNLTIPTGHCVALVGLSGSGKSTIANILLNLYPTDVEKPALLSPADMSTDITFSGRSIKRINTTALRSLVSIVSQTPVILPGTIADNIAYGLQDKLKPNTRSLIETAAEAAGVHSFIMSLPQGYETVVGEGGSGLSGGQAQRIAIARALVRNPNVLILDEATSALDNESSALIRETISNLLQKDRRSISESQSDRCTSPDRMTIIIITHAKDMMQVADWICMLDEGRVVEKGSYDDLVQLGGHFASLVKGRAWHKYGQDKKRQSIHMMRKANGIFMP
jgi:ATP-binding cassette subfamily B (MDR/TAP) protein 1